MSNKILFVATVDKGHILKFHVPYLKYFKGQGYQVHVACAGNADIPYCDIKHEISFERSPYKISNIRAYKNLKKIINENEYTLIHCHTPMGGVIGRLAAREARKKGTVVLYTAHGFHFYTGSRTMNWLLYYPIEKWLSKYTDHLITINEEDYQIAINKKFKSNVVEMVNGVGVDLVRFSPKSIAEKDGIRKRYGYKDTDFILMYTAELNYNKHQDLIIDAISHLNKTIPEIKLLLVGEGSLEKLYKEKVIRLGLKDHVDFLGFRNDIPALLKMSDIGVSSSRREGLPVNIMEAMATGLPLVVTNCRGNRDLVKNSENGFVVGIEDSNGFAHAVKKLYESKNLRDEFGERSLKLVEKYSLDNVMEVMREIYLRSMGVKE